MLAPRLRVLLASGVDRTGVNTKFRAAAGGQDVQVKPGRPLLAPQQGVFLSVVAEIPDEIDGAGLPIQQAIERLDAIPVNQNHAPIIHYWSVL